LPFFWPAAGVSAGVLIALGSRTRWPVVCRHYGCNHRGESFWRPESLERRSLCLMQCRGKLCFTAWFIEHYFGTDFQDWTSLRNVLGLAAAAIIGAAVSGIGGATAYKLFHSTTTPMLTTLAALVRIRRTRNNHGYTAADRACLSFPPTGRR